MKTLKNILSALLLIGATAFILIYLIAIIISDSVVRALFFIVLIQMILAWRAIRKRED